VLGGPPSFKERRIGGRAGGGLIDVGGGGTLRSDDRGAVMVFVWSKMRQDTANSILRW
jgi:hypothetical protein